jgi:hypothetical protein
MKKNILVSLMLIGLLVFIIFFARTTYQYYQFLHSDDPVNPYVRVMDGNATIVRGEDLAIDMGSGETYEINEEDIIITKASSYALVNWPDRSKTRLWPNTRLIVKRMRVARDYSTIEIELAIEQGKIWTNVVRTMYPGSYFRTKLPTWGIIAWVRGTTFDINLDLSYIRSVDHSITLTDSLGHVVSLLPGEAVNAKNILEKISLSLRDRLWIDFNMLQDATDELYRTTQIQDNLMIFRQKSASLWGWFVQNIVSKMEAFKSLQVIQMIQSENSTAVIDIPEKYILEWYQHFQDKKFVQEREAIRTLFSENFKDLKNPSPYIESLARWAIWDRIAFSGMSLNSANQLIDEYSTLLDARIKNVLKAIPINELEQKSKETLRTLLQ